MRFSLPGGISLAVTLPATPQRDSKIDGAVVNATSSQGTGLNVQGSLTKTPGTPLDSSSSSCLQNVVQMTAGGVPVPQAGCRAAAKPAELSLCTDGRCRSLSLDVNGPQGTS
ncbi:hypothetical protein MOR33_004186 [Salmonella enterica]|nr:hypothetical protein [Salmonella enterica]EGL7480195.1 hypothetical protein [Salmonella enterica]EIZ2335188.1 hypothetical protein [Salmonella enterica]